MEKTVKAVLTFVAVYVVASIALNTMAVGIEKGYNLIQNMKLRKRIKDGLKEGTIVEVDGEFYEYQLIEHVDVIEDAV